MRRRRRLLERLAQGARRRRVHEAATAGRLADAHEETVETGATALGEGEVAPDGVRTVLERMGRHRPLAIFVDEFDRLRDRDASMLFADTIKTLSDRVVPAVRLVPTEKIAFPLTKQRPIVKVSDFIGRAKLLGTGQRKEVSVIYANVMRSGWPLALAA